MRILVAALIVLAFSAGSSAARTQQATVGVYPSGTSFTTNGAAPANPGSAVSLAMPIGGTDDAVILVRGAQHVSVDAETIDSPLTLQVRFAHFVSVDGTLVPDALEGWDGSQRATEETNQPLWVEVTVPQGAGPATYHGSVSVDADGNTTVVPITVTVFNVALPAIGQVSGALLTAFNFSPQSYGAKVNELYGITADQSLPGLFAFLSQYRISPNNWGYGNPDSPSGYTSDNRWWLNKSANMVNAVGRPSAFASMWIPISSNRWPKTAYVAGLSPFQPSTWCSYLRAVRGFWQDQGWLNSVYPYLYPLDEPGTALFKTVQQQATVSHSCFPGSRVVITGRPTPQNAFLWNGGSDDVDAWAVLASRYYGQYTNPAQTKRHISHAAENLGYINQARRRGKQIWTYNYQSTGHSTPGFTATEPVSDPRMLVDWAALEGITGLLYGQGTTSYESGNPLTTNDQAHGSFALIYPGRDGPIPSARLEEIREGIEDWEILNVVRKHQGQHAVVHLLSSLFSTTATGAELGCTVGCALKTTTPYSWPVWSHNASTATKLAEMRLAALQAAS
ncbi:MAG TPA: glycoside hydrolase domain-containing protein [Gaiellaceae bacterium]|nr:glycoside hydrolase domain-containing protein [Gaiellaceae bacterium]